MHFFSNQWTTVKLYDKVHPQLNVDECMDEADYISYWKQITKCGLPVTREESTNEETPLWEEVQGVISKRLCTFTIEGRMGSQSFVIDDHKAHCEVNPAKHRTMSVQFIKHVLDNRWGMIIDMVLCSSLLLLMDLQFAIKEQKSSTTT
jgi:hypothetical protein